jgi:hypothetical protein
VTFFMIVKQVRASDSRPLQALRRSHRIREDLPRGAPEWTVSMPWLWKIAISLVAMPSWRSSAPSSSCPAGGAVGPSFCSGSPGLASETISLTGF